MADAKDRVNQIDPLYKDGVNQIDPLYKELKIRKTMRVELNGKLLGGQGGVNMSWGKVGQG